MKNKCKKKRQEIVKKCPLLDSWDTIELFPASADIRHYCPSLSPSSSVNEACKMTRFVPSKKNIKREQRNKTSLPFTLITLIIIVIMPQMKFCHHFQFQSNKRNEFKFSFLKKNYFQTILFYILAECFNTGPHIK